MSQGNMLVYDMICLWYYVVTLINLYRLLYLVGNLLEL